MIRLIFEDIEAVKKYYPNIDNDTFMELISLDPTYRGKDSLGKYGKWVLNLYNKGNLSDTELSEVTPLLQQFTTYRNRIQNKDLNSYKSLQDLSDILASVIDDDSMLTDRQKVRFLKNVKAGRVKTGAEDDYDIVLDTPNYIVYVPNTHEASMKLGKGTMWCTAHEDPKWYKKYTKNNGKLYIVKNKQTGDRWQYSDKNGDFLDQNDEEFDVPSIMKEDEKLSKFFEKFLGIDFYSFDGTWIYDGKRVPEDMCKLVTRIIIPDSYDSIRSYAFESCWELKSVNIPNSVTSIEDYAFRFCKNLKSITIPNSVTLIGDGAFWDCENLKSATIPNSVTFIGDYAFKGCENLESITIPNSVTSIGKRAFLHCENLKTITIPNSVTSIDEAVFYGCPNLTVYTDSDYVLKYCKENDISVKPAKEFKNESIKKPFKLRICE